MSEAEELARFNCLDCGVSTLENGEYYMVTDEVWLEEVAAIDSGMLCIGCLEERLGRRLTKDDFILAPINDGWLFDQSPRLQDRLSA